MHTLQDRPAVGAFCWRVEGGLPSEPRNPYNAKTIKFRDTLNSLLNYQYPRNAIGGLVTALTTGQQRCLPTDKDLIEPVPEHGVIFYDPDFLLDYTKRTGSFVRHAARDLVMALTTVEEITFPSTEIQV